MKELFICYKIRKHKRDIIAKFLDIDANKIRFCSFKFTIKLLAHKFHLTVLQWASQEDVSLTQFCKRNNITCIFVEDGFIRSKGLGALHNKPYSLVFDKEGIYYNPKASSLVTILNNLKNRDDYQSLIKRAQVLKQQIIKNHISKYNLVSSLQEEELNKLKEILPKDKKIILVPGQVEGDASIIKGGMGISTNQELLRLVKEKNKDAFILSLIIFGLMVVGYFCVYLFSPHDVQWLVDNSMDRIMIQILPIFLFLFSINLRIGKPDTMN